MRSYAFHPAASCSSPGWNSSSARRKGFLTVRGTENAAAGGAVATGSHGRRLGSSFFPYYIGTFLAFMCQSYFVKCSGSFAPF